MIPQKGKNKDEINARRMETTIFITEGDSASGLNNQIKKRRKPMAVFSLRGKLELFCLLTKGRI